MADSYDVIVVGAGNAGLSAAAHMAKSGYRTLLLERHNAPGGCATSFRRGRFEFEAALHELAMVGSEENPGDVRKLFADLGADVDWHHENSTFHVICTDPEEPFDADMPCGVKEFIAEMERQVPGCAPSVQLLFQYGMQGMKEMGMFSSGKVAPADMAATCPTFMRMATISANEGMDLLGVPKKAQHILSTYWPYLGEPTDSMSFIVFCMMNIAYVVYGAGMPGKFSHELSLSLEGVVRANGGDVWYNCEVEKILVKDGKAYGVAVNGKEIRSDHIICNVYPNVAFGRMIDADEVPAQDIRRVNARELAQSFVTMYLGLNKTPEELGIKDYTLFLEKYASSTDQYQSCFGVDDQGLVIVNCLNLVVPECTPEGTCQLFFTTSAYGDAWSRVKPEEYKATKLRVAEELIDYYEKTAGVSIKPYIEEIEVATPVTLARYLNTPNGTPYGYRSKPWDTSYYRAMNLAQEDRGIEGLRFCGAFGERTDGYNSNYSCGQAAAYRTIADIKGGN